jgi:hypothetical protein
MAGKEVPDNIAEQYVNPKGYTPEQIRKFNNERVWTAIVAIMQDDGADTDPQSGTLLFSERQKKQAENEQKLREDPALAEYIKKFRAVWEEPLREIEENPYITPNIRMNVGPFSRYRSPRR